MAEPGGPHLTAALLCERVLTEQDGALSAIRMIDRVFFVADPKGNLLQSQHPVTFLISLKSGSARGNYSIELRREKPSGEQSSLMQAPVFLEGEDRGASLVLNALFEPDQQGLYWFDVLFEGERATRIPLRAIFQRLPTAGRGE